MNEAFSLFFTVWGWGISSDRIRGGDGDGPELFYLTAHVNLIGQPRSDWFWLSSKNHDDGRQVVINDVLTL